MTLLARKTPNVPAELPFPDLEPLVIRDCAAKLPRTPKTQRRSSPSWPATASAIRRPAVTGSPVSLVGHTSRESRNRDVLSPEQGGQPLAVAAARHGGPPPEGLAVWLPWDAGEGLLRSWKAAQGSAPPAAGATSPRTARHDPRGRPRPPGVVAGGLPVSRLAQRRPQGHERVRRHAAPRRLNSRHRFRRTGAPSGRARRISAPPGVRSISENRFRRGVADSSQGDGAASGDTAPP